VKPGYISRSPLGVRLVLEKRSALFPIFFCIGDRLALVDDSLDASRFFVKDDDVAGIKVVTSGPDGDVVGNMFAAWVLTPCGHEAPSLRGLLLYNLLNQVWKDLGEERNRQMSRECGG
jgi:hypothetical protein